VHPLEVEIELGETVGPGADVELVKGGVVELLVTLLGRSGRLG